jgi:hypothetical protein
MTTKLRSMFGRLPQRLASDTRGVTLALVALTASALIGFTALGVETGLWYAVKRQNQSAADVAALSGAFELLPGKPYSDICGFAKRDATRNGFRFALFNCPANSPGCTSPASGQMCANNPPKTPGTANFNNANAVEVILAQQENALFASLSLANVTIHTRAVAVVSILDQSCLLALDQNPNDSQTILIQGNSTINAPNCSIADNTPNPNAIFLRGAAATVTADTLVSAGGVGTTGNPTFNLNTPARTNAPPVSDPYAATLTHVFLTTRMPPVPPNACAAAPARGATTTYPANSVFCNGLATPNGGGTVNLSPGTYWVTDGDLAINSNGVLECTLCNGTNLGVTIIFTTTNGAAGTIGAVTMQANAQIGNLNAPNSGTFAGLLFVQDTVAGATYTSSGTLQGGSNVALNGTGLVYFPHTNLAFQGTPQLGANGCLLVVANQVTLAGNSTLSATGCSSAGLNNTPTVKTVALAE